MQTQLLPAFTSGAQYLANHIVWHRSRNNDRQTAYVIGIELSKTYPIHMRITPMQKAIIWSWCAAIGRLADPDDTYCTWTSKQSTPIYIS